VKAELRAELTHTQRITVDRDRTIGSMDEATRVYSTPWMVLDVERTCKDFLAQHLLPEQNSFGMRVEISHLGPGCGPQKFAPWNAGSVTPAARR
jgi:predicted thioesterase